MALYCFLLFRDGEVMGQTDCQCADDLAAIEIAVALAAHHTVEIYSKNRLVSRIEHAPEPRKTRNRQPS
ncbi:MAG TPA: hypothetical protein VNH44_00530 [Micropepsaceae bacterium]|nr:hypothetical protein [Micropepsaceae bacterium]